MVREVQSSPHGYPAEREWERKIENEESSFKQVRKTAARLRHAKPAIGQ